MTQTAPNTTQGSDRLWICRYIEIERDKKVIKEIKGDTGKELQVIDISIKEVAGMLSIAVCDDELLDCCNIAKSITKILEEPLPNFARLQNHCIARKFLIKK